MEVRGRERVGERNLSECGTIYPVPESHIGTFCGPFENLRPRSNGGLDVFPEKILPRDRSAPSANH